MLSREAFEHYDRQIRNLAAGAEDYTRRMIDAYMGQNPKASVEECREFARQVMLSAARIYGNALAMKASGNGAPRALVSNTVTPELVEKVARHQAGKLVNGDAAGFARECASFVSDATKRAANDTTL